MEQADKYRAALKKLLQKTGHGGEPIEVICIVGKELADWANEGGRDESARAMNQKGIRVVMYQQLLESAYKAYQAYLDKKKEAGRVLTVIQSIEASEGF